MTSPTSPNQIRAAIKTIVARELPEADPEFRTVVVDVLVAGQKAYLLRDHAQVGSLSAAQVMALKRCDNAVERLRGTSDL